MKKYLFFLFFSNILIHESYSQIPVLFGVTPGGGGNGFGNIFRINGDGSSFQEVFAFDSLNGYECTGNLMQDRDGFLYGNTQRGGLNNSGVLFKFNPITNSYTILHHFENATGELPRGSVCKANDGKLYGMTTVGGINDNGVIFSYDLLTGFYDSVYCFHDSDGGRPSQSIILGTNGKLYGFANLACSGVLFEYTPSTDIYSILYEFCFAGRNPDGNLIQDVNGNLYGITTTGGAHGPSGTLFKLSSVNNYSTLYDIGASTGSMFSQGPPALINGQLFGVTNFGGQSGGGILFSYDLGNSAGMVLINFNDSLGKYCNGGVKGMSDDNLYGMTTIGGNMGGGVIYKYNVMSNIYSKLHDFNGTDGGSPLGELIEVDTALFYVSIEDEILESIEVFPNPTIDKLIIRFPQSVGTCHAKLFAANGQVVCNETIQQNERVINISNIHPGIYFLNLIFQDKIFTKKIIVQKN